MPPKPHGTGTIIPRAVPLRELKHRPVEQLSPVVQLLSRAARVPNENHGKGETWGSIKEVLFAEGMFLPQKTALKGKGTPSLHSLCTEQQPCTVGGGNLFVWQEGQRALSKKISFRVPWPTLAAFFLTSSTSEKRTDRHSRWEAVRVHDDVGTDARITKWHVFLRDDQATNT